MHPLNPEAGRFNHMPEDPRAVDVVLRSGRVCLRAFPYLWWRYGERGHRFILSDSAYLVTMAEYGDTTLHRHARWTADVLAPRGMPRWLLERHLELLSRMLLRALPDRPELGARIGRAATELRELRLASLSARDFERCADCFAERSGLHGRLGRGFGALLAAAVADERSGLVNVVESVESWACDPLRFGPRWIAAVEATLVLAESSPIPT